MESFNIVICIGPRSCWAWQMRPGVDEHVYYKFPNSRVSRPLATIMSLLFEVLSATKPATAGLDKAGLAGVQLNCCTRVHTHTLGWIYGTNYKY